MVCRSRRMRSMAAPVVPMKEASTQPRAMMRVLVVGVARMSPLMQMPPVVVNRAMRRRMKGT